MATLTRPLRRALMWSLGTAAAGIAGLLLTNGESNVNAASFWVAVTALTVAFGSLMALPAPGAAARGRLWLARATLSLAGLATSMMFALIIRMGLEVRDSVAWRAISLATVPVCTLAVAAAFGSAMTRGGAGGWAQRLRACGYWAGFLFAALVSTMIVIDSGNRTLFKLVGILLLVAVASGFAMALGQWRERRRARSRAAVAPVADSRTA